jgi:WD40 repeat protein
VSFAVLWRRKAHNDHRHYAANFTTITVAAPQTSQRSSPLAGYGDRTAGVWDLTAGSPVGGPLTEHTDWVPAVATAVLPDGRVVAVTGSMDDTVRVWDLTTGAAVGGPLTGHTDKVAAVATAVLPDGRVVAVTGSGDHTVRVWDLTTRNPDR